MSDHGRPNPEDRSARVERSLVRALVVTVVVGALAQGVLWLADIPVMEFW
jgi:hypothetical protein